jgi:CelD/BcsL family acetyltransferase involved in cellulose biosynthesis
MPPALPVTIAVEVSVTKLSWLFKRVNHFSRALVAQAAAAAAAELPTARLWAMVEVTTRSVPRLSLFNPPFNA